MISGAYSDDSRLAKTRDHDIHPKSGSYATGHGRHQSVIGCRSDDVMIYDDVGLQINCDIMIHSERVVCGKGEVSHPKRTITTAVSNAPSSSSGQYCHGGNTERGMYILPKPKRIF